MKVGNIVILANLGELKVYEAMPRDLEAEAGLKPTNVKLDLVDEKCYSESHKKLHEMLTDQAGRFKGGSQGRGTFTQGSIGEKHTIEQEIEEDVLRELAKDISDIIIQKSAPAYLALPDMVCKRIVERISPDAKAKVVKTIEKDLIKVNKTELPDQF
ncbi:host attachment protein [Sulfurovum sp. NBC37-1]|uniref:host attachment protein n=1 Tax=Sulfurovum sp. (strain NBC37-1) TaxID=387093 RepID=UPI00015875BB|nr:host attachment protein [Sulfurovum sp. NBC37-1]BAF72149.1 conserved hypothetical protein [Sulfurovum sp. NBC37-1]